MKVTQAAWFVSRASAESKNKITKKEKQKTSRSKLFHCTGSFEPPSQVFFENVKTSETMCLSADQKFRFNKQKMQRLQKTKTNNDCDILVNYNIWNQTKQTTTRRNLYM